MGRNNFETHRFFCINCGHEGIPLMRQRGHQHADQHRKKLYCPHCKQEMNHIECKTQDDVIKFKEDFSNGKFINEAEESISYLGDSRVW